MLVKTLLVLLGLGLVLGAPANGVAAIIAQSDFNVTDEGWRVGTLFSATATTVPFYLKDIPTNNGWIETAGLTPSLAFAAPTAFLGDKSAAYGGSLQFDLRIGPFLTQAGDRPLVVISDGTTELQFRAITPPLFVFVGFDIPSLASAGWEISNGTGAAGSPATEAQLLTVLGGLTRFRIEADWNSNPTAGDDVTDLDNVRLIAGPSAVAPEPASLTLILVGAIVVGVAVARDVSNARWRKAASPPEDP
jgi:hypothetical protein